MSSTEYNKQIVLRFVDRLINCNDPTVIDELVAEDFIDHDAPPEQERGPMGAKATWLLVRSALDDFRVTTEDIIAEGDKVVTRHKAEALHVGRFLGRPATGKHLHWQAISIYRIVEGKLTERWGLMDTRSLAGQMKE